LLPFEQTPLGLPKGIRREQLSIYGASDYATTADGGDYTVHVVVGIDQEHRLYLLDLWRKQSASDRWVESFCDLVQKWRPIGWAEETGQIKASVGPFLRKRLMERQLYIARKQFPTRGDKAVRCQAIRGRMAQCGLFVPVNAPWFASLKAELMVFPNGRNDDQADALGLIGQILDLMVPMSPDGYEFEKPKLLSTDPMQCTVTLDDLFEANERRSNKVLRIH